MKKSEKMLLGGLLAAAGAYFGLGIVQRTLLAPLQELRQSQTALTDKRDASQVSLMVAVRKEGELGRWRAHSLPPNAASAQTAYQQWVFSLMSNAGFEDIKAEPQPIKNSTGSVYSTCSVKFNAVATLDELTLFLERFESVDLMHRIDQLKVESDTNEGDPELKLTIVAEGLSLKSAPERTLLFPKTELFAAIRKDESQLIVTSRASFPEKAPFLIRVGEEFINVVELNGDTWTVQRGMEKSFAENHAANVNVELFPLVPKQEAADNQLVAMKSRSPFTKPAPKFERTARLESRNAPTAVRGNMWSWRLAVADWNPAFGQQTFELLSGPPGMTVNKRNGQMNWRVGNNVELGEVQVSVLIYGPNGEEARFTPEFSVRVRDRNPQPRITTTGPLRFFIGRQSSAQIQAEDTGANPTRLRYALQNAPDGMSIDQNSGQINWRPSDEMQPGDMNVTVQVTDSDEMPENATQQFQVVLAEDSAQFAYLTGYSQFGDQPAVGFINDRITNKETKFRVGDEIKIADFDLKVVELHRTFVIFQRNDEFYRLNMDVPLVKMMKVERPQSVSAPNPEPAAEKPAEAAPAAQPQPTPPGPGA